MLRRPPPSFDGIPFIGTKQALHRPLVGRDSRLSRPDSAEARPNLELASGNCES